MNKLIVDGALEEISNSQGSSPIFNILETAAITSNCAAAALVRNYEDFDQIEASYGSLTSFLRIKVASNSEERKTLNNYLVIKGASKHPKLTISKLIQEPLGVRFLASMPIRLGAQNIQMQLIVADDRENVRRLPNLKQTLESFADLTSAVLLQSGGHAFHSKIQKENQTYREQISNLVVKEPTRDILADDPAPLSNFLLETLVKNKRVHSSDGVAYHSLRRWRQPVKAWQIAAFRNLKRSPCEAFLTSAAFELTEAVLSLMGAGAFDYVVPVACGNSGPGCFAEKLSERVAELLNIKHAAAFHPLAVCGNSHPKRNVSRPKMKLRGNLKGRILLVDDIATSGSHMVEATKLLRGQTTTVVPIAWVSA